MRISISRIARELDLKPFQLHKWEERGWLGSDPVLKDPENNNQRVYSQDQEERIRFIHETIAAQRDNGIKRTDFQEMEELLLEKFGGEVTVKKEETLEVLPSSIEAFQRLLLNQSMEIAQLREMVSSMQQKELPVPVDHAEEMEKILNELAETKKREAERQKTIEDMNEKLQKAVDFILEIENKEKSKGLEEKKSLFKRIFG